MAIELNEQFDNMNYRYCFNFENGSYKPQTKMVTKCDTLQDLARMISDMTAYSKTDN